jgi:cobalt-zinc-cadmium efflux system protein
VHLTSGGDSARVLSDAREVLHERGLEHATVQIESPDRDSDCSESF